ncbi:hypothetical protein Syun_000590 [Stephania yunnanensis]|uniref:Uncharacterized protein n=1 Tax=Stephania yunnanensis TaxID=152371 RepID=A0AAP0LF34_9MAGN
MATIGATLDALMERLKQGLARWEQELARMEAARNEVGEDVDPTAVERLDALGKIGFSLGGENGRHSLAMFQPWRISFEG